MKRLTFLAFFAIFLAYVHSDTEKSETLLSSVLTPDAIEKKLNRQGRSYYDPRLGPRPLYPEERPSRCGRCYDDRYDDRDDGYDRSNRDRDRYDDDRRVNHKPTYGNRLDRNKNYDNEEDDRRYSTDRNSNTNKNGTEDENNDDKKRPYDDKEDRDRPSGSRDRNRNRNRDRYDDRDRYRPDYYDRFLSRDPYRPERPYYEEPYRERRPLYDRYDDPYAGGGGAGGGYGGRYDGYSYPGYRRPVYDDRYDRGNGYDDAYGGYGPGVGRGPHDSFRPWDETYRGQAGWDAGGRGYYFASGRPDAAPASAWGRPDYARPPVESAWQNPGSNYAGGYKDYRDPLEYRGTVGYGQGGGYRQDVSASYGQNAYSPGYSQGSYGQGGYSQAASQVYGQGYGQGSYGQAQGAYGQGAYGQGAYGQGAYGQGAYGQGYSQGGNVQSGWHNVGERLRPYRDESGVNQLDSRDRHTIRDRYPQNNRQPTTYQSTTHSSTTTPQTSYLYQRDNEQVTAKVEETTKVS